MKTEIPEGYKNTPVGIIPEEWEVRKLGEICTNFKSGQSITSPRISYSDKYPVYGGNGLRGYTHSFTHSGDHILIGRQGALCGNINFVSGENFISEHAIAVKTDLNNDIRFWALKLDYLNLNRLSESSAQPGLSVEKLIKLKVSIPPLLEQKKIAEILLVWDVAIEKQTLLIEKLELRKRALMQQLLTGKKRLSGFEGEWKKFRLDNIGKTFNGLTGKSKDDFGSGKPYLSYVNIFNNTVVDTSVLEYVKVNDNETQNKVQFGDVFFTVSSETQHEVGMSSVLLDTVEDTYLNSFCFGFRLYDFDIVSPYFIGYYLRGGEFRKKILKLSQGATRYNLSKNCIVKLQVKFPSLPEQTAIAEILSTADQGIHVAKEKLEQLKKQKKGLMQVLLTGKKRVITTTNTQTNENIRNQKPIRAV